MGKDDLRLEIAMEKTKQEKEVTLQKRIVADAAVRVFPVVMFLILCCIIAYQYIVRCWCP